jgi:hypothetical protein
MTVILSEAKNLYYEMLDSLVAMTLRLRVEAYDPPLSAT